MNFNLKINFEWILVLDEPWLKVDEFSFIDENLFLDEILTLNDIYYLK